MRTRYGASARLAVALAVAVAAIWCAVAYAEPVLLERDRNFSVDLGRHTKVYFDPSLERTIGQLAAAPHVFAPVTRPYVDFGLTDARIWLRVQVANPSPAPGIWRLDLKRQYLQELLVYIVRDGGQPELLFSHGKYDAFDRRPVLNRYLALDVALKGHETAELFVAYRTPTATWLPWRLSSLEAYADAHRDEELTNWLINGALIAMIVIALLMIPVIGWRLSLVFCFYILAGGLFVFHAEGYTFQYLWPDRAGLNEPLGLTFLLLMALSGPLFARVLFDTRKHLPRFDLVLRAEIAIIGGLALASVPMFDAPGFKYVAYPAIVIVALMQFATGVLSYRTDLRGSTPFMLGAVLVVVSLVFALLGHMFPGRIDLEATLGAGHITLLTESIAFAAAIVIRVLGLRRERDEALRAELAAARDKIRLDAELRQAQSRYDAARSVAERRRMQLSSVGHDIRQPIAALRTALSKLTDADSAAARQITAAFDYLEELARSKVEAGPDDPEPANAGAVEKFPLRAVLDNVRQMFAPEAAAKNLEFRYRPVAVDVKTEPITLMRLVNNLVANAIKHTQDGGVLLAVRRKGDDVCIEVHDTGPGMDQKHVEDAVKPFRKGEASTGDGLGLAIVSERAAKLGYAFALRSRVGRGAVASLRMPVAK